MVPRRRSKTRAHWPPNLYTSGVNGYKYRRPDTREESWMGTDYSRAAAAARKLNALLTPTNDLVARVVGTDKTVADALRVFREDDMPSRGWGAKTAAWYEVFLARIAADLGDRALGSLSVKDLATYIRDTTESPRSRQTYRLLLCWILACAVQEGWIDFNPAEQTRKFSHTRKRERLTKDAYWAIHAVAPAWLQNAMDLSLLTLLRREDVAAARVTDVRDGALWVIPQKTEGRTAVRLRIAETPALAALVARCRDDVLSPFLVHRLPERARPKGKQAAERVHHTQVMPAQLSRAFKDAREKAGVGGENPTSFHEIRSLGGHLLMVEAGWTKEQVQALMGHAEVATTTIYLDGHEQPWTEVAPGLSLTR